MKRGNHLRRGIPVLASLNIDETVAYYKEKLGFNKVGYKDANYAVIARDEFVVHFWKCNEKIHPENTSCYIDVEDIENLYLELQKFDIIHPNAKLETKPYGMKEFAILDVHGNLIRFGEEF